MIRAQSKDRENILDTTYQELPYIEDYCLKLEIDFLGENTKDLGGPKLEWIELCNSEQYIISIFQMSYMNILQSIIFMLALWWVWPYCKIANCLAYLVVKY